MKLIAIVTGMTMTLPLFALACSGTDPEPTSAAKQDLSFPGVGDGGLPTLPILSGLGGGFPGLGDGGFTLPTLPSPTSFLPFGDGGFPLPAFGGGGGDGGFATPTFPSFGGDGGFSLPIALPALPFPLPGIGGFSGDGGLGFPGLPNLSGLLSGFLGDGGFPALPDDAGAGTD
jgi:hypothetical protein